MRHNPSLALRSAVFLAVLGTAILARALGQANDPKPPASPLIEITTPTNGVDFNEFVKGVVMSVQRKWYALAPESAKSGAKGEVVVGFLIRKKDGSLEDESPLLEVSSGRKDLDDAALSAIKSAAPFKKFPQEFSGQWVGLRFRFRYNLPVPTDKK